MSLPWRNVVHQRETIAALGGVALKALGQRLRPSGPAGPAPVLPSEELVAVIPPRAPELIRDHLRAVGGDAPLRVRARLEDIDDNGRRAVPGDVRQIAHLQLGPRAGL
jgi:hypothetical protein